MSNGQWENVVFVNLNSWCSDNLAHFPVASFSSDRNGIMRLSNELLLDILQFLDFTTLTAALRSHSIFHDLVRANELKLAKRRNLWLWASDTGMLLIRVLKTRTRSARCRIQCDMANPGAALRALRMMKNKVGAHRVEHATIGESWLALPSTTLLDELPVLRYVETLSFDGIPGNFGGGGLACYLENFDLLKSIYLGNSRNIDWTFLRCASARRLTHLRISYG